MNKSVYRKIKDEKLLELVSNFKYVPYTLNRYSAFTVGHIYWSSECHRRFKVVEIKDDCIMVRWEDRSVSEYYNPLDIKHDYELKPFEYDHRKTRIINNSSVSISAAEIKALLYNGLFKKQDHVITLLDNYFFADHSPNDYNYYFVRVFRDIDKAYKIRLKRDLDKCQHNFYNIKTLADLHKDPRIKAYELADKNRNIINTENRVIILPEHTPVLNIEYRPKQKYLVVVDF